MVTKRDYLPVVVKRHREREIYAQHEERMKSGNYECIMEPKKIMNRNNNDGDTFTWIAKYNKLN